MNVDAVQPSLAVHPDHRKQDASGKSGGEPCRDDKSGQKEQQDRPTVFRNDLGQLTGKNINVTA